jgi:3-dehydrotetronate 4-kinase
VADLGVVADDFTGATDIATAYARRGHRAVVLTGPAGDAEAAAAADVVVVALKSRTAPVAEAVDASLAGLERLRALGCRRFVFKYCSTFDSTDRGNIGPVLDALAARTGARRVVVAPAFPANGRTVYQGHLFVGDRLLEDSPMRSHPLTPMTRSRLVDVLGPQTPAAVGQVVLATVRAGADALRAALDAAPQRYLVVDSVDDEDLRVVAAATAGDVLVSGGAGIALGAPEGPADPALAWDTPPGRALVVSGSASARTREQVAHAVRAGAPTRRLDVAGLRTRPGAVVAEACAWIADQDPGAAPVLYAVGDEGDLSGEPTDAARVEEALARVAAETVTTVGVARLLVAGGETSGAVVRELGVDALRIGPPIAPGVCWALGATPGAGPVALALKSGNFGDPDLFATAWEVLP